MVWTPTEHDQNMMGWATARVDIPILCRRSLRDEAELLHQLANQLTRLSLDGPEETLTERSALILAQSAIQGCHIALREIKNADMERIKEARTAEKVKSMPKWGVERKAG